MKTIQKLIFPLIIVIIVAGAFGIFYKTNWLDVPNKGIQENNQQIHDQKVVLSVDNGKDPEQIIEMSLREGWTAFDVLKNGVESLNLQLKTKDYENLGTLVESIGGIENGLEGKYWLYYVNGQMPATSADKQKINPGDKVEFKFEKSPF